MYFSGDGLLSEVISVIAGEYMILPSMRNLTGDTPSLYLTDQLFSELAGASIHFLPLPAVVLYAILYTNV